MNLLHNCLGKEKIDNKKRKSAFNWWSIFEKCTKEHRTSSIKNNTTNIFEKCFSHFIKL